jgi:carbon monoxide dehydrogenase subunit G
MHLEGKFELSSPRPQVWDFLSDPKKFGPCLPELEELELSGENSFKVIVKVGMLFFRGKLKFDFTINEENPPSRVKFEGVGRGAGVSIKLFVNVDLFEKANQTTELVWSAEAELGGLLAEISQSVLENSTAKFTLQFFQCVKSKLELTSKGAG